MVPFKVAHSKSFEMAGFCTILETSQLERRWNTRKPYQAQTPPFWLEAFFLVCFCWKTAQLGGKKCTQNVSARVFFFCALIAKHAKGFSALEHPGRTFRVIVRRRRWQPANTQGRIWSQQKQHKNCLRFL
jgi:hypothetical protein